MADKFQDTVTFAIVKAELHEAHQAIADIWSAWFAWTVQDITDVSHFEEAMARGLSCLPPEYRTPEMPAKIPYRKPEPETALERKIRTRRRSGDVVDAVFETVVEPATDPLGDFDDILG